jgi:acetyl-CoA C-acetyltransferase
MEVEEIGKLKNGAPVYVDKIALKSDGIIELEKKHYDYDSSLRPIQVDEVVMGHVLQGGQGQNTARQACIYAGIPKETPAFTVNKVCASGLKAIILGAEGIPGVISNCR